MFCAGEFQSDYFLVVVFFAAGALAAFAAPDLALVDFVAFAAPALALVDFVALVDLAAPVFAFADFGAAVFATAVFALVDLAAVALAAVLFAAIPIFLRADPDTDVLCRMSAGAKREQPRVLIGLRQGKKTHL